MYEKMYLIMFWGASDAIERLKDQKCKECQDAIAILERACQNAEEVFLSIDS